MKGEADERREGDEDRRGEVHTCDSRASRHGLLLSFLYENTGFLAPSRSTLLRRRLVRYAVLAAVVADAIAMLRTQGCANACARRRRRTLRTHHSTAATAAICPHLHHIPQSRMYWHI